ncbi:MAG: peptide ABC transporter substrate-binding protein [Ktedonobacteraceae bacterium]
MLKKPRPRFLMMSFSLVAMLLLILSACGGASSSSTSSTPSAGTPVKGGTWTDDLYEEPSSLIPNGSSETFSDLVDTTIYAPLFLGNAKGTITPGIVSELPTSANGGISADLKTWTFHLKPGLKWSDGQPLTAQDVDYTWKLWTNPKFTPASTTGFNLITSSTVSSDNLSITFHLKAPFSPFLAIWTDGLEAPMPAHVFSSMDPAKILTSSQNLNPTVTSGPFKLSESVPGDHYTVVRNPNYYQAAQGLPYLDKIVFRVVTNQDTILKDFQSGSIDSAYFLDVSKFLAYQKLAPTYTVYTNPNATNFEAAYFNFHNPILGTHVAVRKAIAMAIDHNSLIQVARRGYAVPLCTDHGQAYVPGYQANAACPTYDPAAAKQLLAQDGWTKADQNGILTNAQGQRLEFKYSTTANNIWRADDELLLQQQLKAIGIQLDIQNYPASTFFGTFLTDGKAGVYDIAEFENSWTYDADDASLAATNQIPPNGFNIMFYSNKQLDTLYTQEEATADATARQQAFDQEHQIYLTDFPFITLYSPVDVSVHKNTTQNYAPGGEGAAETVGVMNWWCTNGQC